MEEMLKIKVDIWKHVIDTQQHFNNLEMKVRNFGILLVSAFVGAAGVSFKSGYFVGDISLAFFFFLAGALLWLCFYFVDIFWYHPLLLGSVYKGIEIEKELEAELPNIIDLTHRIGKESPSKIWPFYLFTEDRKLHSTHKAHIFYLAVTILVFGCAGISFFAKSTDKEAILEHTKQDIIFNNQSQKVISKMESLLSDLNTAQTKLDISIKILEIKQAELQRVQSSSSETQNERDK